ncbi:MAG: STAS domain-containing protein [Alphaproteobacteria bacterium]
MAEQNWSTDDEEPAGGCRLARELDLTAATALRAQCLELMSIGGDVEVDVSDVETVTTPCIQVLLAAERSLAADGRALRVAGASESMRLAFADLGLDEHYRNWSER